MEGFPSSAWLVNIVHTQGAEVTGQLRVYDK